MLQMPIVTQTVTGKNEHGVTLITVETTDWSRFLPALAMLKLPLELAETAIGKLSIVATLLDSAGFVVHNPKADGGADALLDGRDYIRRTAKQFLSIIASFLARVAGRRRQLD
jgi:hypothetical protein